MDFKWIPNSGVFINKDNSIVFKGNEKEYTRQDGETDVSAEFGELLIDKNFSGGTITAEIEFEEISDRSTAQIIIYYYANPAELNVVTVGLSPRFSMFEVREFVDKKWNLIAASGDARNLEAKRKYILTVNITGSLIHLLVDGISVLTTNLPYTLPQTQVGMWCQDYKDIIIHDFQVETVAPKAFVVMEFSGLYNDLYTDVIKRVCEEFGVEAVRADDFYNTGLIISDIIEQIIESKVIIAEITPTNANVYYEVGYAHALNKPTILLAQKGTKLPFDVSPFRVLFYENNITGTLKLEEGLKKHLIEVLFK